MTFQTLAFLALVLAVLGIYWLLGRRQQNLLLLVASYVFYGYVDPILAVLLAGFTVVMYLAARCAAPASLSPSNSPVIERRRRAFLGLAIVSALALLVVFKFLGFFVTSASDFVETIGLGTFSSHLNLILPIGISFYTLQALGYVIDVYRGRVEAREDLLDFSVFISFFPQLLAGPIERASRLLPQFETKRTATADGMRDAITLLLWGFFKKLVIADNVGVIADNVFAAESPGFALLWVGVLAFGLQIFADFSGYTDIARGTARLFGINLSVNFDHPNIARSPADFWRRWHISLSTWFRDYVYIPLGGSRTGRARSSMNLMVTFLLSGLWHGASWNFALWGGYHGGLVLAQRWLGNIAPLRFVSGNSFTPLRVLITFLVISVGWLLFRENDIGHIWQLLQASPFDETAESLELAGFLLTQVAIYSLPVWFHTLAGGAKPSWLLGNAAEVVDRTVGRMGSRTAMSAALFSGILLTRSTAGGEFIYFQF